VAGAHASDGRRLDESSVDDAGADALSSATPNLGGSQAPWTSTQASTSTSYGRGSVATVNCGGTKRIIAFKKSKRKKGKRSRGRYEKYLRADTSIAYHRAA
jgi:hypothetical protein